MGRRELIPISFDEEQEYYRLVGDLEDALGSWDNIAMRLRIPPSQLTRRMRGYSPIYFENLLAMRYMYRAVLAEEAMKNPPPGMKK